MQISEIPSHLSRYKDLALLLWRHGRVGLSPTDSSIDPEDAKNASELATHLENMGPTFVKLGQMLSTRHDLLPEAYTKALSRLQNEVGAFGFGEVERIVESETGVSINKAFSAFESKPLAAASLGQVHRARLRDGRRVVVKVQRPEAEESATSDLEVLSQIAEWLDSHTKAGERYRLSDIIDEFERSLLRELDYREEAENLTTMAHHLEEFDCLVIPRPIDELCSRRVLTMDYVSGTKLDDVHPVVFLDLDGHHIADQLLRAYLHQFFVAGFFHADPHPGNVLLTRDGKIALIDLGMIGRLGARRRDELLQLLLDLANGDSDSAADKAAQIGRPLADFDEDGFRRDLAELVGRNQSAELAEIEIGQIVMKVTQIAGHRGLRIPPELFLIGKTLLNLDGISRALAPDFVPQESIRRHASELVALRVRESFSPSELLASLLEAKTFVERLPARAGKILDTVSENRLAVKVDVIDEDVLIVALQKIANRIAAGLLLAALVVGAALMMRIETDFTVLGYPGLAMILFVAAAAGSAWLLWDIVSSDRGSKG